MSRSISIPRWSLCMLLFLLAGCGEPGHQFPEGGLIVDDPDHPTSTREQDADHDAASKREPERHSFWNEDDSFDESRESTEDSDDSRKARRMPSDTERWGSERKMPSDSMPSKTEKWGSERKMPSDSMPSKTEKWGSERKMPSDSMPSRSFPRRSEDD